MDTAEFLHVQQHARLRACVAAHVVDLYNYFLACRTAEIDSEGSSIPPSMPSVPDGIDSDLHEDCCSVAETLVQAVYNTYAVSWDATRYADRLGSITTIKIREENDLMERFPPLTPAEDIMAADGVYPVIRGPAVITDRHGNILVWSLPNILPERRQEHILNATRHLEQNLYKHPNPRSASPGIAWRLSERFFTKGSKWRSGQLYFAAGWFRKGHTGPTDRPVASKVIQHEVGRQWMNGMQPHGGLLDGILAVTHPALYRTGLDVQQKLSMRASDLREYLAAWPTVFNAVQVIVNRMTIHHRDTSGRPGWFDLLLSMGTYGERGVMSFRNLGASVPYDTGSVVAVNSRVVIHSVPEVPADRICYAFFMSDFVHNWVGQEDPGWSKVTDRRRGS